MSPPGIDEFIPQSEPDRLLKLMKDLLYASQHLPKPNAICFYNHCDKDDKNENHGYGMCEKEVHRKEMYSSDFNFEVSCEKCCRFFLIFWVYIRHT